MSLPRFDAAGRAEMARNIAQFDVLPLDAGELKRAAVCLIVTNDGQGGAALVLTMRVHGLRAHSGQFALPGGRMDPGEDAAVAARREAHEEIGLDLLPASIIGYLDDYPTRSGYLITPVVIWAPQDAVMCANPAEVARIFRVPLDDLNRPGSPEFVSIPESDQPVIRYPMLGTTVHAPTAAVLYQFMEVVVLGRHTRVAHLEQPTWAWR